MDRPSDQGFSKLGKSVIDRIPKDTLDQKEQDELIHLAQERLLQRRKSLGINGEAAKSQALTVRSTTTDDKYKTKNQSKSSIAHVPRPFVGCSIPATISLGVQTYKRRNGKEVMEMTAVYPNLSRLPHGSDINLMIWLGTKYVLSRSNIIRFNGVNETLREMMLEPSTQNIEWLKAAITRAHRTMIYYTTGVLFEGGSSEGELIITKIEGIDFKIKKKRHRGEIYISQKFLDHATIPVDLNVIRSLGRCKIALSIYLFQQKRNFYNKNKTETFIRPEEAVEHLGIPENMPLKTAKHQIKRGIKALKTRGLPCMDFNKNGILELPYFPVENHHP